MKYFFFLLKKSYATILSEFNPKQKQIALIRVYSTSPIKSFEKLSRDSNN